MVSWQIFRESAVDVVGEDLVKLVEKSFKNRGKDIDPHKFGDVLLHNKKIDETERDLLNEAFELLQQEEEANTILSDDEANTILDNEEHSSQGISGLPILKKFQLVDIIGEGGMGRVYKGVDPDLGRPVAVKEISAEDAKDYQKQRFQREILLTAKLDQEHRVIRARAVDSDDKGNTYFIMDFVEGKELTDYVDNVGRGITYSLENVVELIAEALDAMSVAHDQGIIHRDIKPDNIMVDSRNVKIMDWGLAKEIDDEEIEADEEDIESTDINKSATYPNLTLDGTAMGTPRFMSPEQAIDAKYVDARSDLYSFGAILYKILTGESPNLTNIKKKKKENIGVKKILVNLVDFDKPAVPPSKLKRNVPAELESICMKALEKDPDNRYQTAAEFRDDLRAYLKGGNVSAHKYSTPSKISRFIQRHTAAAVSAFIVITALGAGGVFYQTQQAATARAEAMTEKEAKEKAEVTASLEKERADKAEKERTLLEKKLRGRQAEIFANQGKALAEARKFKEAIVKYSLAIKQNPQDEDSLGSRAIAYYHLTITEKDKEKQRQYLETARKDVQLAIKENPQVIDLYRTHALIEIAFGNKEKAREIYARAMTVNPENLDLLSAIAGFHNNNQEWSELKEICLRMIQINKDNISARVGLFSAYSSLKDLDNAEKQVRYLTDSRKLPNSWFYLGQVLYFQAEKSEDRKYKIEKLEEAKESIERAEDVCDKSLLPDVERFADAINNAYQKCAEEK